MADQSQAQQQFSHAPVQVEASDEAKKVFQATKDELHQKFAAAVTPMPNGNIVAALLAQVLQAAGPALIQVILQYLQNQGQGAVATQQKAPAK